MNELMANLDWLAIIIGTIVSFVLGALWYSEKMFGKKWAEGTGVKLNGEDKMVCAMVAQFIATFLLAITVAVIMRDAGTSVLCLITVTILALNISGSKWSQKGNEAIAINVAFIIVKVVIMAGILKVMM